MDPNRFDRFARSIAVGKTRRQTLKIAVAGVLGVAVTRIGVREAEAVCRELGRTCSEHAVCCSGFCGSQDATGRRRCACPSGTTACGEACVNIHTDENNCGACNSPCATGAHCDNALCCPSGEVGIDGACCPEENFFIAECPPANVCGDYCCIQPEAAGTFCCDAANVCGGISCCASPSNCVNGMCDEPSPTGAGARPINIIRE